MLLSFTPAPRPLRVGAPGPDPPPTPPHTNLSPNRPPSHHSLHPKQGPTQNFAADLAVGVPPPQSQLFFPFFGAQNRLFCQKVEFLGGVPLAPRKPRLLQLLPVWVHYLGSLLPWGVCSTTLPENHVTLLENCTKSPGNHPTFLRRCHFSKI